MAEKRFWITKEPIAIEDTIKLVVHPHAGAVNTFTGIVREFTHGKQTLYLEYVAYESMAEKKLAEIGREIHTKWPGSRTAIVHRIGHLDISDIAVAISVATPHRPESFAASRYAIERIKEIVPIWKKEVWADGEKWVGDQLEKTSYPSGQPEAGDLRS